MNGIFIVGNLVADPELKTTTNGKTLATFTLAERKDFREGTNFHNCVAWGGTAEFVAKWFTKAMRMAVAGKLNSREYEKDGAKRIAWEVVVERVEFCERKKLDEQTGFPVIEDADELPF